MAAQTKSVSGNVTTYTITDEKSNAMTVAVTAAPGQAFLTAFGGSAVLSDGLQMLTNLLLLISTGILP